MKAVIVGSLLVVISAGLQNADEPASIEVRPASLTLRVGEKATLEAVVKNQAGTVLEDAPVIFSGCHLRSRLLRQAS